MSDPVPRKTSTELKEDDDIVECGPETGAREGANEPVATHPVIAVDEHLALRSEYNDPYLPSQETENPLTDQGNNFSLTVSQTLCTFYFLHV